VSAEVRPSRKEVFAALVKEMDESEISGAVNFDEHRYVLAEGATSPPAVWHYVSGHKSLSGACEAAGQADEPFGQIIYDLDSGEEIPLDITVTVLPRGLGLVTGMTKIEAHAVKNILAAFDEGVPTDEQRFAAARVAQRLARLLGEETSDAP
jgi:hypothetical protein